MATVFSVFITLLLLAIIFAFAYWAVILLADILPTPIKLPFRNGMLVLLCILGICCLLDLIGVFGVRHLVVPLH